MFNKNLDRFLGRVSGKYNGGLRKDPKRVMRVDELEARELFAVSNLWLSDNTVFIQTDNYSTSVEVFDSGNQIVVEDVGTDRRWTFDERIIERIEFRGGEGNDEFSNNAAGVPCRAFGNGGNDVLRGGSADDDLVGGEGEDELIGRAGDDRIWGQDGRDKIRGGAGDDQLMGGNHADEIWGGAGHDRIWGQYGDDVINGGSGNDRIVGNRGDDHINGGSGNDAIWGSQGDDVILGGSGNDQLMGGDGDDHLNGQMGNDKLWGQSGDDTLIAIDGAFGDYVNGGTGSDVVWADRLFGFGDQVARSAGSDVKHSVWRFANDADSTLNGDRIADPRPLDGHVYRSFEGNPLFSSRGPRMTDVRQGSLGNCYAMAGLAAVAKDDPIALEQNIVDFNDGTFGVRLGNRFYRLDADLPVLNQQHANPAYAKLGAEGSLWVALVEKALAHHRRNNDSYASIEGGWAIEINEAFRSKGAGSKALSAFRTAGQLANEIALRLAFKQSATIGFISANANKAASNGANLIMRHMYAVDDVVRNHRGAITGIRLYNPWGVDGAGNDGRNDGFITVTPFQLLAHNGRVNWGAV